MFNQLHLQTQTARRLLAIVLASVALAVLVNSTAHAQEPTGSISGRVFYQGIQPEFLHLEAVVLVPVETTQPISVQTLTDQFMVALEDDGRFAFTDLAAGSYLLGLFRTENPDYIQVLDRFITVREDRGGGGRLERVPAVEISLRAGEQLIFDIPIVLPDFAATPQPTYVPRYSGTISGRITATGPTPGGQFSIALYPADAPQPINPDDNSAGVIYELSGAHADYTFLDIDDGEYFLRPEIDPLLIGPNSELVNFRYRLPVQLRDFSPEEIRGFTRNPELLSYYDSLSDLEIRQQIRDGGLTFPVRVLRVRVANGEATTGVDFTLEYAEVQPASLNPDALPSSGAAVGTGDGGWSTPYVAAALSGLTALAIAAGVAILWRHVISRTD